MIIHKMKKGKFNLVLRRIDRSGEAKAHTDTDTDTDTHFGQIPCWEILLPSGFRTTLWMSSSVAPAKRIPYTMPRRYGLNRAEDALFMTRHVPTLLARTCLAGISKKPKNTVKQNVGHS